MPSKTEIEKKFWEGLKSDRTVMLGLDGVEKANPRPMTAQFDEDRAPIWFFTSNESELVKALTGGSHAIATFAAKDHTLFATMHGNLSLEITEPTLTGFGIDLSRRGSLAGRKIPKSPCCGSMRRARKFGSMNSSLLAGIKLLLGADPKEEYKDKVAEVSLR